LLDQNTGAITRCVECSHLQRRYLFCRQHACMLCGAHVQHAQLGRTM
jgi:hypothetical protein